MGGAVSAMAFDSSGILWYSCCGTDVYRYDPATNSYLPDIDLGYVNGMAFDSSGILWYGNSMSNELWEYNPSTNTSTPGPYLSEDPYGLAFQPASAIPEPSTLALLAAGAVGLLVYGWRRRKQG